MGSEQTGSFSVVGAGAGMVDWGPHVLVIGVVAWMSMHGGSVIA